ncbi:MAG: hypothetical protein ACYS6K_28295 [Planctomycetota bacterium]
MKTIFTTALQSAITIGLSGNSTLDVRELKLPWPHSLQEEGNAFEVRCQSPDLLFSKDFTCFY